MNLQKSEIRKGQVEKRNLNPASSVISSLCSSIGAAEEKYVFIVFENHSILSKLGWREIEISPSASQLKYSINRA